MENPYAPKPRKRNQSPPVTNSFQNELKAKMKERKKKGLSADVTSGESALESQDELPSDDELLANFDISRKGHTTSPRKSPSTELNGTRSYDKYDKNKSKIFGKKSSLLSDDEDKSDSDDDDIIQSPLMTTQKPMGLKTMLKTNKSPGQSFLKKGPKKNLEDQVDAALSSPSKYEKNSPFGSYIDKNQQDKTKWEPPKFSKTSLLETNDEQLKLDLQKTKQRAKSPKPGRKTPSDLGSITEEREWHSDDGEDIGPPTGRSDKKPVPKPRRSPYAELITTKPRAKSPSTDIFGKSRTKSPFTEEEKKKPDTSGDGKKTPELKKQKSVMDHLGEEPKPDKKGKKNKDNEKKSKYLNQEDSDDSIGGELGRKDAVQRKSHFDRTSPFDKDQKKYDDRKSPFDTRGRKSPLDIIDRKHAEQDRASPFDKRKSSYDRRYEKDDDGRRSSPVSIHADKKRSIKEKYDEKMSKESDKDKKKDSKKDDKNEKKKQNPYSKYSNKSDTENDDGEISDKRGGHYDKKYDLDRDYHKNDRHSHYDADRYGKDYKYDRKSDERKSRHDDDRYSKDYKYDRKSEERKSPYGSRHDYDKDRRSPYDHKRRVEFDPDKPPSLKEERQKRQQEKEQYGHDRGHFADMDRPPSLRKGDDISGYDNYKRKSHFDDDDEWETWRSRSMARATKSHSQERESSVCREVEADPSAMKKPLTEEEEKIKKKEVQAHTKESKLLNQVINSVKEEQNKFRPVDPDKSKDAEKTSEKKGTQSARHRPKPRYAKPVVETFPPQRSKSALDLNNTTSIREAVFLDWYKERQEKIKKEKEEKRKQIEEAEKTKKEEEERDRVQAQASYKAWMEKKKDYLLEKEKKKRKEDKEKESKEEKQKVRKDDAQKAFLQWKEKKDETIIEKKQEEKKQVKTKKEEEKIKKETEKKDAEKAFIRWKERKEQVIKESEQQKQKEIAMKKREEKKHKERREKLSEQSYETWCKKKNQSELEEHRDHENKKLSLGSDYYTESRKAWSPANRTIPFGR